MKAILLLLIASAAFLTGCVGPVGRHYARVDRRYDRRENVAGRVEGRHYNRYDRRGDRYDRVQTRYGYW